MSPKTLRIHDAARKEANDANAWYRARSTKAARGFVDELERVLARIFDDPSTGPAYLSGTRRAKLHRYPYIVVYKVRGSVVQVVAVAHTSRRPGYWAKRRFDTEAP
jgi:plasmid stabilization system protein ParE